SAFKVAAFGLVLLAAQSAKAQTVGGGVSGSTSTPPPPPPVTPPPPPPPPTTTPDNPPPTAVTTSAASNSTGSATPAVTSPNESADSNTPDHEAVIGHFAVGYMGISQLPIGGVNGNNFAAGTVTAPVIGVRYWLNRMIGIDGGIGFGFSTGSSTVSANGTDTTTNNPSQLGFALHGGVPLAFAHGKHYSFELVPELNVGFTHGSIAGTPDDVSLSGFRLDAGARVGAEIYFGFIGVPQLALQASVGAYFTHENAGISQGNNSASVSSNAISTSVQGAPWAIFVNSISALYYF
ncbi:MAG TPA: hypothetical protein VF407_04525, partial [Polyangiaceae bacterium]